MLYFSFLLFSEPEQECGSAFGRKGEGGRTGKEAQKNVEAANQRILLSGAGAKFALLSNLHPRPPEHNSTTVHLQVN